MKKGFNWYVHGLWIVGAIFMFLAALIIGNIELVEASMERTILAALVAFALVLVTGACWISAAFNSDVERR